MKTPDPQNTEPRLRPYSVGRIHSARCQLGWQPSSRRRTRRRSDCDPVRRGPAAPAKLAESKTDDKGAFKLTAKPAPKDTVLYIVAKGGTPKAAAGKGAINALALLSVLGLTPPKMVTVNELTTVSSAFTAARFVSGESISGNPLGLRIAAGNAPNLVDPATGGWGRSPAN